jgi:hypothetical protein
MQQRYFKINLAYLRKEILIMAMDQKSLILDFPPCNAKVFLLQILKVVNLDQELLKLRFKS